MRSDLPVRTTPKWVGDGHIRTYFDGKKYRPRAEICRSQEWGVLDTFWTVKIDGVWSPVRFTDMDEALAYIETVVALKE